MLRWGALVLALWVPLVAADPRLPPSSDVARLERILSAQPDDIDALQSLAAALLGELRITPRADLLDRADALILRLRALHAPRSDALDAWRLLILHRFDEALVAARRARASGADPFLAAISEADALTELGRYAEAEGVVQFLLDHHYGSAALSRAAHLRRLFGDVPGAIELAAAALRINATPVERAWLQIDLAELLLLAGQPQRSLSLAVAAQAALPASALAMQARALQAVGDERAALARYRAAAGHGPRVEVEVEILRLAQALGDTRLVASTTRLLAGMARLAQENDSERRAYAEFFLLSDDLPAALALARAEWRQRPDIFSAAQLAWLLFRAGQQTEAGAYAARALALHPCDPLLQWRAGTVLAALGDARGEREVLAALKMQPWLAGATPLLARQP